MAAVQAKSVYHQRASSQMEQYLAAPDWSAAQKLAMACRMLAAEGHDSGLAGQLTARVLRRCESATQPESTARPLRR